MYTRCPECETVFRIEREDLDAADGEVRCGRCSGIFDARAHLTESLPPKGEQSPPADAGQSDESRVEEAGDDENAVSDEDSPDTGETAGDAVDDDAILEFSLPEDRWNEVFIDDELSAVSDDEPAFVDSAQEDAGAGDEITLPRDEPPDEPATDTVGGEPLALEEDVDAGILVEESDDSEIELYFGSTFPGTQPGPDEAGERGIRPEPEPRAFASELNTTGSRAAEIENVATGPPVASTGPAAEIAYDEPSAAGERFFRPAERRAPAPPPRGRYIWGAASVVLAIVLVLQLVHVNRNELAALPGTGGIVAAVYRAAGISLEPQWNVDEYRVVASAAAAEAQQSGTLRIHATLANTAERAQPFPLIHLTLTDRWGDGISERMLEPMEYMGAGADPGRMLEPGAPIEADIAVVDPGEDAFGFELDVCLRDAQRRVRCSDRG